MKWIARVFVFVAALVLGTFAGSLFAGDEALTNVRPPHNSYAPLTTQSLLGSWNGTWGYDDGECTLEITSVDGNDFYGTLKKEGAEIRFEGTFDPGTRHITLNETEVVTLGGLPGRWSLGTNKGIMSPDGRILVGTGNDEWGNYGWAASNY
jgi:hypothetical protein